MEEPLADARLKKYPLLSRLEKHRVLVVSRTEDGLFRIEEACDNYYDDIFSPEELAALGMELVAMAGSPQAEAKP